MNNQASSIRKLGPQFYNNFNLITINVQFQKNHLASSVHIFTLRREKSKFNLFYECACAVEDRASVRSACGRCRIGKASHWHVNSFDVD